MGALDTAVRSGQGPLRRDLLLRPAPDRGGRAAPARPRHAAADPSALLLDVQPLDRGRAARRARPRGGRRDRVLAARPGAAHRQVPRRRSPRTRACAAATTSRPSCSPTRTCARVRALNEIAQRRGQTLAQMAIAWALRDPRVTSALLGREQRHAARAERRGARRRRLRRRRARGDRPLRDRRRAEHLGAVEQVVARLFERQPPSSKEGWGRIRARRRSSGAEKDPTGAFRASRGSYSSVSAVKDPRGAASRSIGSFSAPPAFADRQPASHPSGQWAVESGPEPYCWLTTLPEFVT